MIFDKNVNIFVTFTTIHQHFDYVYVFPRYMCIHMCVFVFPSI